jgi:hypothetical protein
MELSGKNIIIVSNEGWGDIWFSKHNYAYELSKRNNVLFIDPPGRWSPMDLVRSRIGYTTISPSLRVLRYTNRTPALNDRLFELNNTLVSNDIRNRLKKDGWPVDLFISFDPARLYEPTLLGAGTSLFIAVDAYDGRIRGERYIFDRVDRIVTISEQISKDLERYKKPLLTISHAISSEEFEAPVQPMPQRDFGLYVGTLDKRVDIGMLKKITEAHPEVPFLLIGRFALPGVEEAERLIRGGRHGNVHYLGVLPFKELKAYIAASRFCIAPMDFDWPGNDISHHKIFQYLAFGKPVFCNVFTEYIPIAHLLYMRNDQQGSLADLAHFLANGESMSLVNDRIEHARTKTYEVIFRRIEEFMDATPLIVSNGANSARQEQRE